MTQSAETNCLCSRGCSASACATFAAGGRQGWWCLVLKDLRAWMNGRRRAWQVAAEMFARMD